jgi:hypothetical protein
MPGTFSQVYFQIVFAASGRENLIGNSWKTELYKYIAGFRTKPHVGKRIFSAKIQNINYPDFPGEGFFNFHPTHSPKNYDHDFH